MHRRRWRSSWRIRRCRTICSRLFFFQAEDGIRDAQESRRLGDVYKRQSSVNGLTLVLGAPATINGQITVEGSAGNSVTGLDRVQVQIRASVEGVVYSNLGGVAPQARPTSAD